ncbi:glycosyl hydrolases family 18 protein [Elsinoe australis]|uniref:chitinase n=1 Tax=Elsinoe australis TaxID=40998 RepID=A0A4V6DXB3_9PEZI|nr:glycosyl hydrolases family 18 protein [Elsinoe australis]
MLPNTIGSLLFISSASAASLVQRQSSSGNTTCVTYNVKSGDSCSAIGGGANLTVAQLEAFNSKTWAWQGCDKLQAGINMCLSAGQPPLPASVPGTICGPLVVNTTAPAPGQSLADLNPCPLNACCSAFGYCGITPIHCALPPNGTALGAAGCISNCGTDITNNKEEPEDFIRVGYFQGDNAKRPCLNMDVTRISRSRYTHIHFSFATLTPSFDVNITSIASQFVRFKTMTKFQRILTFGGWDFSTSPSTYMIFRDMVQPANRDLAATNIANFITNNNLDGVDIDWEYPEAPDMPSIPPGESNEGELFVTFLRLLKDKLPNKSVSIAMPAGYWYMRGFPVKEITEVVDYAVFMSYDYHGLWDYGSAESQVGCANGDCLRSHVNITETMESLALVTKAGAKSDKIVVGVTSYGRGYKMVDPSCTGPDCHWTRNGTQPVGRCTRESGIMADAEIEEALAAARRNGTLTKRLYDEKSDTKIAVIGDWWVGYMDKEVKRRRTEKYRQLNFRGTTDWAVDYQSFDLAEPKRGRNRTEDGY